MKKMSQLVVIIGLMCSHLTLSRGEITLPEVPEVAQEEEISLPVENIEPTPAEVVEKKQITVPKVADIDKNPLESQLSRGKGIIMNNIPSLIDGGASVFTVASYVIPFDGEVPEGFGAGIGINLPLESGIEAQFRGYWTDDKSSGATWMADFGAAYRYKVKNSNKSVYTRAFLGYKGVPDDDLYYGAGVGLDFPLSEKTSFIIEPSILLGFDKDNALQVTAGISWEF